MGAAFVQVIISRAKERFAKTRPVAAIYSARSIEAGSIRTAWITGRNAANNAPASMASDGSASVCKSVAFT
jgi:hypothetical protein